MSRPREPQRSRPSVVRMLRRQRRPTCTSQIVVVQISDRPRCLPSPGTVFGRPQHSLCDTRPLPKPTFVVNVPICPIKTLLNLILVLGRHAPYGVKQLLRDERAGPGEAIMKHELQSSSGHLAGGTATNILRVTSQLVRAVSRTGSDLTEIERTVVEILSASSDRPISTEEPGFQAALLDLLREVTGQHEARDDRYRALLDTVADITSEEDPDRLLGGIADRARRLLRADVVYLWLAEREGAYAHLGATSGGMTSELLDLRVPAGMAMTGRIIDTGMPLIVSRYFDDQNFVHYPEIDRVMDREKIVATVGVPLVNGSKRLGALIAANRDERAYTPADLDLLHSLAGHAAISIERSRLSEETKSALQSLETANHELARSNAESERAATAHFTLSQVALAGGNIDNLVQEVVKIVGGQLAVFDPDGRLLADGGDFGGTAQPPELIRLAALARTTQTAESLVAIPILAAARLLGILYYQADETPAGPDIQILERAAVVAALLLLLVEAEAGAAGFRRDDFIDDLLSGEEATGRLIHRAAQLRMELRQPYTIHVVRCLLYTSQDSSSEFDRGSLPGIRATTEILFPRCRMWHCTAKADVRYSREATGRLTHRAAQLRMELQQPYTIHVVRAPLQQRRLAYLADEVAKTRGGLAGQCHILQRGNKSSVVALIPGSDPRSNSEELSSAIARAGRVTPSVAGAGPTREVSGVRELFDEAVTCSDAMERVYGGPMSGTLEDLGFIGLVLSNRPNVDRFVRTMLDPVARYDAAHHTELLSTLEAILATDGSPTAAAEALHVHVSTVKQRMQRLKDLLGDDWRTVERTSELRLAMKLCRLKRNPFEKNT
ncbi:hypothetical protein Pd630_LPD09195 (plasmid) [Rhodococcus opacus PD630]|nr:hypothetical protein Pd630_LPD09195 [Rhodococcus opacus PD630]